MHPLSQSTIVPLVQGALNKYEAQLKDTNHKIWTNPELAYEEYNAHDVICTLFESLDQRFDVQRSAYGVETAFQISYASGKGGRIVVFNAEYDALPGIGHACGHNLIATSAIAAFLATCKAMQTLYPNDPPYAVRLLGTPAEEGGGGKLRLIEAGAYQGVDACLMVHPFPLLTKSPDVVSASLCTGQWLANNKFRVSFTGRPAHASGAPWEGVNALDAVVAAYNNLSLLRQQIRPTERIHGVVINGGDRPNIIPECTTVEYYIRSDTVASLKALRERVMRCFEAAALATGCKVDYEEKAAYMDIKSNVPICEAFNDAMNGMGHRSILDAAGHGGFSGASTDMGNVSYVVPGFHGGFYLAAEGANHTSEFTRAAGSSQGFQRSIQSAAGMAIVSCRVLADDEFAAAVKADFDRPCT
ncbi:hypothetical protein BJX65DRAFT_297532 [Aspergillus insuetus]